MNRDRACWLCLFIGITEGVMVADVRSLWLKIGIALCGGALASIVIARKPQANSCSACAFLRARRREMEGWGKSSIALVCSEHGEKWRRV